MIIAVYLIPVRSMELLRISTTTAPSRAHSVFFATCVRVQNATPIQTFATRMARRNNATAVIRAFVGIYHTNKRNVRTLRSVEATKNQPQNYVYVSDLFEKKFRSSFRLHGL
ncbi:MAG: hypothetical protein MJE12_25905 [Alphaproteobacteria bacterium]|nr:hypothetical protein [Alphaproteobacteria bacterium]